MSTVKSGGSSLGISSGGEGELLQEAVDPDNWVTTFFRAFKTYVTSNVDENLYKLVFSYPDAKDIGEWMPLPKSLIHFEIDKPSSPIMGFGRSIVDSVTDDVNNIVTEYSALKIMINMDVGVWTTAASGGITARLKAFQVLSDLFAGAYAYEQLQPYGIEIKGFDGGTFIKETIDDIDVFRIAEITLMLQLFARRKFTGPYIQGFTQDEELTTVDGTPITP